MEVRNVDIIDIYVYTYLVFPLSIQCKIVD